MIIIRNAETKDVPDINKVFYETWLNTYPNKEYGITEEDINEYFKDIKSPEKIKIAEERIKNIPENSKYIVAELEEKLIGICIMHVKEDFNQLQVMYILPEYQGRGIGNSFWNECLKHFDRNKKIILDVFIYNKKAISFYESLGFKDNGKRFTKFEMPISKSLIPEMEMEIL